MSCQKKRYAGSYYNFQSLMDIYTALLLKQICRDENKYKGHYCEEIKWLLANLFLWGWNRQWEHTHKRGNKIITAIWATGAHYRDFWRSSELKGWKKLQTLAIRKWPGLLAASRSAEQMFQLAQSRIVNSGFYSACFEQYEYLRPMLLYKIQAQKVYYIFFWKLCVRPLWSSGKM